MVGCYLGQKGDALEHGVLGNYFGLPSTTSPENTYFTDKLSPDSIPCRTRAKRGCATHPRSIAERVGCHSILKISTSKIYSIYKLLCVLLSRGKKNLNVYEFANHLSTIKIFVFILCSFVLLECVS